MGETEKKRELRKRFAHAWFESRNATKAAIAVGAPAKTAAGRGSDLLKHPEVTEEIKRLQKIRDKEFQKSVERVNITKEMWLRELWKIASADMDDFVEIIETELQNGKRGRAYKLTDAYAIPTTKREKGLGAAIRKITQTKSGVSVELHSKQSALDLLGKHFGWIKDQPLPSVSSDGVRVVFSMPDNGRRAITQEDKQNAIEVQSESVVDGTSEAKKET